MSATALLNLHDDLCSSAKQLMVRKNHDYTSDSGDPFANFRGSSYLGIDPVLGVMLRMQDKMMRVRTFAEKGELKVKDEGVKDALVDLVNYTVLMYGLILEEKETKPEQEKYAESTTPAAGDGKWDSRTALAERLRDYKRDPEQYAVISPSSTGSLPAGPSWKQSGQ